MRAKLQGQGLKWLGAHQGAPWDINPPDIDGVGFLDIAFVDDVKRAASHIAGVWCDEARSRGLCVNFKKGQNGADA